MLKIIQKRKKLRSTNHQQNSQDSGPEMLKQTNKKVLEEKDILKVVTKSKMKKNATRGCI